MTRRPIRRLAPVTLAVLVTGGGVLGAGSPRRPADTGAITGVVHHAPSAAPARRTLVTLRSGALVIGQRTTDDAGRFSFDGLAGGRYAVTASRASYLTTHYGSRRPGRGPAAPLVLDRGERIDLAVPLYRGGVIAGTVRDHLGGAHPGAIVSVVEVRRLSAPLPAATATGRTDDRGEFRIFGLPPGEYVVAAQAGFNFNRAPAFDPRLYDWAARERDRRNGRGSAVNGAMPAPGPHVVYAPTFHPAATDPSQAAAIAIDTGDERSQIDVALQFARSAELALRFEGPNGPPPAGLQASLLAPHRAWGLSEFSYMGTAAAAATALRLTANRTTRAGLTPGRYVVMSRAPAADSAGTVLWAVDQIEIAGDRADHVVTLRPGTRVSGRVRFAPGDTPPEPSRVQVELEMAPGSLTFAVPPAQMIADGSFVFPSVPPGRFRLAARVAPAPAGGEWWLESASRGRMDLLDAVVEVGTAIAIDDLELSFSRQPTGASGRVLDRLQRPAAEYVVVIWPADRGQWGAAPHRTRTVPLGPDGAWRAAGLPSGDYLVAVVTHVDDGDLQDGGWFDAVAPAALPLSIARGVMARLDLQIGASR